MFSKNKLTETEKSAVKKLIKRAAVIIGSALCILAICLFTFAGSLLFKQGPQICSAADAEQLLDQSGLAYYGEDNGAVLFTNADQSLVLEIVEADELKNEILGSQLTDEVFNELEAGFKDLYGNTSTSSLEISKDRYRHLKMNASEQFLTLVRNGNVIFRLSGIPAQKAEGELLLQNMGALG